MIGRNNCYFKQDLKDSLKKNKILLILYSVCIDIFHLNLLSVFYQDRKKIFLKREIALCSPSSMVSFQYLVQAL